MTKGLKKVIQVVPTLLFWTPTFETALRIHELLAEKGYDSHICSDEFDPRNEFARSLDIEIESTNRIILLGEEDVLMVYVNSRPMGFVYDLKESPCKKILFYEGALTPETFEGYSNFMEKGCRLCRSQLTLLADEADYCFAATPEGKTDLAGLGYKCPIDVHSLRMDPWLASPRKTALSDELDDLCRNKPGTVVLFRDSLSPGSYFDGIIDAFHRYRQTYDDDAVLLVAGQMPKGDGYYTQIRSYIEKSALNPSGKSIMFLDGLELWEVKSCYEIADCLVSLGDPVCYRASLAEAALYGVPVVSYAEDVDGELRIGVQGLTLPSRNPQIVAEAIECVINDNDLANLLVMAQRNAMENDCCSEVVEVIERLCDEDNV